jgi:DNA-binding IclR family transcriptional regulator
MENKSMKKGIAIILALAGHEVHGMSPTEIAKVAQLSPAAGTCYRQTLEGLGLVEEVPGIKGRYRLGPRFVQIALAHQSGLERVKQRVAEVEQRFSRAPR